MRLVVRIGANTGVGIVGDPSGGRALVTGDPVNTAARLEQAAGPGEVLDRRNHARAHRRRGRVRPQYPHLSSRGRADVCPRGGSST